MVHTGWRGAVDMHVGRPEKGGQPLPPNLEPRHQIPGLREIPRFKINSWVL